MLLASKGRRLTEAMPPNRVLTETDGPFARNKDAPLMPWDVTSAVNVLSSAWEIEPEAAEARLLANLRALLSEPKEATVSPAACS